jgi:prolyl-tRNA synthetase
MPAEAEIASHRLLLRAGMIYQVAAGVYSYLPLAWRSLRKIEAIIREEMNKVGGQELMLPVLQPLELWKETGRDQAFGKSMFSLLDRRERPLVLGPTHEEIITQMVNRNVQSYRDLPKLLYQIQTKFRDEPRPRAGLVRVREFIMKDLYSFDSNEPGLTRSYEKMLQAYHNIYHRCGLPTLMVEADSGAIGGKDSHEFMVVAESGEDEIVCCDACKYAANVEKAQSKKNKMKNNEKPLPVKEVHTPGAATIEKIADFLRIPPSQTLKAVFYIADDEFIFVVIRGDIEVNEVKLHRLLKCNELRMASETEVINAGIVTGAASAVGLSDIKVIADDSITSSTNFVAGANKPETHLVNVNYPRDFKVTIMADIAKAQAGDECPRCSGKLSSVHGIEVGHVFKLGTFISGKLGSTYIDAEGSSHPIIMGCYGIGLGRLLAAAVEHSHDDNGIIWPLSIAPYQLYLCPLYKEGSKVSEVAENLYAGLMAEGLEVFFDDRKESPGIKFNDADLLGIPLRVTISPRTLRENSIELKERSKTTTQLIPLDEITATLKGHISQGLDRLSI